MEIKKFFVKASLISLIIFSSSLVLHFFIYPSFHLTPWSWGSEIIHQKKSFLEKSGSHFNNVIIGSSRVYRQIDPHLLDSLAGDSVGMKSFNFGANWLFIPESFYIFNQLVVKDQYKLKYAIIELSKIQSIDYANLHTTRMKYWYTFPLFNFAVHAILTSNFSILEKGAATLAHTISYIDKLINLGYFTEAFQFNSELINYHNYPDLGPAMNGFQPLASVSSVSFSNKEEDVFARNRKFLLDTTAVTKRLEISRSQFEKFDKNPALLNKYNKYYADQLNKMIDVAEQNGIYLVFIVSPRIDKNQFNELIPLIHHIKPAHIIEISDGRKYPELYLAENSFDETHLNNKGAAIYTTILAAKLKLLQKSE